MITVISGIRDLAPESIPDVELAMLDEVVLGPEEIRIGGASGVDTVALLALCGHLPLSVYVPFTLADQPQEARGAAERCLRSGAGPRVVELHLPRSRSAYLLRNEAMLQGAQRLVAFTDGRMSGGTHWTIERAQALGLDVSVVPVARTASTLGLTLGPPQFSAPVAAFRQYVSARSGQIDPTSQVVRRMKTGRVATGLLSRLAGQLAVFVAHEPAMAGATAVVAMPRRLPGVPSDMEPLAALLAQRLDLAHLPGWLQRTTEPTGGVLRAYRMRFSPEEHERSLRVVGRERPKKVILLDNVVTFGGTLEGAFRAVRRDTRSNVVGLAVLYSTNIESEA